MKSIILQMHEELIAHKKTINEFITHSHQVADEIRDTNSTITTNFNVAQQIANDLQADIDQHKEDLLYGIPYSLKDLISTKGLKTTGGSAFLKDYIPPYNATIYESLSKDYGILVGKSNNDEFGLGGTGLHSAFGVVHNIHDRKRIVGGSSSGSVNEVAAGMVPFSIGTDTGDSVRRPASFTGVVGFKPSYGLISRFGVLPYAPSMDHLGIVASYVADIAIVAQSVIKYDERDYTSQVMKDHDFFHNLTSIKKIKFTIIEGVDGYLSREEQQAYLGLIEKLKKAGHEIISAKIDLQVQKALILIYRIITFAEACSCYANMTGIHFGLNNGGKDYEDVLLKSRTSGFGRQLKRRFTIGAYITKTENFEPIYQRSKKIRTYFNNITNDILKQCDALLLPGASSIAPTIESLSKGTYRTTLADDLLLLANFGGMPSITIPFTKIQNMPFGINVTCKQFEDQKTLNIAYTLECMVTPEAKHE
ncbi:MAG: Asp-tRNA(Asn)/Glu-tRNA(Gln) amidotransferase GatCAB subunit A [Mycoplasmataceae bacterium]|jgi:aspartyl-tRNA(Asn)/glutamyl-tRNA(Gln) amidotransferase subunit A|nr:Asp-tRNA(Asn)/Glu-tRNA(Gln) amidotransferase GatCAB subunit A [Mycoplasmataceae bacterium]